MRTAICLATVFLAGTALADAQTDTEWEAFAQSSSIVRCRAAVPKNPEARRVWSAYSPTLTA